MILIEALLRMFNRLGDGQNRRRSHVKFLVESLGMDRLREEVLKEWDALKTAGKNWPSAEPSSRRSVDDSLRTVRVSVPGGNLTSSQLRSGSNAQSPTSRMSRCMTGQHRRADEAHRRSCKFRPASPPPIQ